MYQFTASAVLGLSSLFLVCDAAQACGRGCGRCAPCCVAPAPSCHAPAAAPSGQHRDYDAPAPATAQNSGPRQAYRSFSAEPTAPSYQAPMRSYRSAPSSQDMFRADRKARGIY
ncbi:MAG: hypothetical protein HZA46_12420 [Planctomycetales bacterium]|nr:hypothetical protein [Planctomycetales bacterium]